MGVKDGEQREGFLTAVEKHFEKIAEAERAAEEERLREAERRARPASKVTAVLAFVGVFAAIYICLRTTGGLYRLTYPDAGLGDL
ncbi:hypothetical protein Pmar_PMAR008975 [Perkinsus marinus ATCC 50983]|nr:hypothetical protein Pmar_PMAR008975 [Perkinsus marinus ATCC 50983]EER02193.1 hypothetical protein Pmar_PMAR008975 [Perkinsus marinus ATCC 50983]|eukprot:XP_002769475.1 hypothetical protein Pmar_PMAR008975 [Perkinsus marinus ATCC 50983]